MRSSRALALNVRETGAGFRRVAVLLLLTSIISPFAGGGSIVSGSQDASRKPSGSPVEALTPGVSGADFTLRASNYASDTGSTKERGFSQDLVLPAGKTEATFTSEPTLAPLKFTDLAPHWRADSPAGTSIRVEVRTAKNLDSLGAWSVADVEDILMPEDSITQTYASIIPVSQLDRTHSYVQSRVTLSSNRPGVTPVFHELTYSFINAGITPNPPKASVMVQGTPADIPKPLMVPRLEWGSPQGASSPKWTPKYRRVTHIIVHHTATPNNDTDFAARVRAIWYFHTFTRGWGDIGYNYVVDPNGVIYEGRAGGEDVEAGHAYPFNVGSLGIGVLGNFMTVPPTSSAQAALIDLISWKVSERGIDPLGVESFTGYTDCGGTLTYVRPTIAGHRDFKGSACGRSFNDSTCPGDRLWNMLPQIRSSIMANQPPLRANFTQHNTPGNITPGATLSVNITVRNTGAQTWAAAGDGAVLLGYQWQTPDGKPVKGGWKDIRTALPRDVPFADSLTVAARLSVPTSAGHFVLIWDMYNTKEGWFTQQGSRPLRVDVVVGSSTADKVAPRSSVLPLPLYSSNQDVLVRWAGEDEPKGSGLVSFDIQSRVAPNGPWTNWQQATALTQSLFPGEDGYTYEFRSRARDAAGNIEQWPERAQSYTTVDTRPPLLVVDSPSSGARVQPGSLQVHGQTEQGAFVVVNDTRADEASGVFTATAQVQGRDFAIHVTAADPAGNVSRVEVIVQAASRYSDVPVDDPAFDAIESLSDEAIVSGYPDGTFKPNAPVSRGQAAKMIVAAKHWGLIRPLVGRYSDVEATNALWAYIETAAAHGALQGYSDGTFRPAAPVSRAEMARSTVLAAGWKPQRQAAGIMLDVQPGSWYANYIEAARFHGIVAPDDEGNFYPDSPATRGATSMMLFNMLLGQDDGPTRRARDRGPE